jgi:hypothetical protein
MRLFFEDLLEQIFWHLRQGKFFLQLLFSLVEIINFFVEETP